MKLQEVVNIDSMYFSNFYYDCVDIIVDTGQYKLHILYAALRISHHRYDGTGQ